MKTTMASLLNIILESSRTLGKNVLSSNGLLYFTKELKINNIVYR